MPALLRDGFTLDPNDVRQAVIPPDRVATAAHKPDEKANKEGAAAAAPSPSPAPESTNKMKVKLTRKITAPDLGSAAVASPAAPASSPPLAAAHLGMPPPASTSLRPSASPRMSMRPSASPHHSPAPPQHSVPRLPSAGASSPSVMHAPSPQMQASSPPMHMGGAAMQMQQQMQPQQVPLQQVQPQQMQSQQMQQQHMQQQHMHPMSPPQTGAYPQQMAWQAPPLGAAQGYFAADQGGRMPGPAANMHIPAFRASPVNGTPATPVQRQAAPANTGTPTGNYAYPRPAPQQQMSFAQPFGSPGVQASPSMQYAQLQSQQQQQAPYSPAYASPRLQAARPPSAPQPHAGAAPQAGRPPSASPLPGGARPPSFNAASGFSTPGGMQPPARAPGPRRLVGAPPHTLRPALLDGKRIAPAVTSLVLEAGARRWRLDNSETCAHALLLPAGCTQVRLRFRTSAPAPQEANGDSTPREATVLLNARAVRERARRASGRPADASDSDSDDAHSQADAAMDVDADGEADADGEIDAEGEPDPDEEILLAPRDGAPPSAVATPKNKGRESTHKLRLRRGQNVLDVLVSAAAGADERYRVFLTCP